MLRRASLFRLLLALALASPALAAARPAADTPQDSQQVENAVVKVFSTMRRPDITKPWSKQAPAEATGTGVIIEGRRVLTNAHVVAYASQIEVQGNQSGDKLPAHVVALAPGIDLAVLELDDASFFDARPPLPRASALPQIKDAVLAYGYPTGGTTLSITRGIVSRIEFVSYGISTAGLRVQIDAAINPGNSGGPAVAGGKMIGLAFSHLRDSENISYIIPNEEIELFLKDIADGHYDGKPGMYDEMQTLENPALRGYLKLDKSVRGMVVTHPQEGIPGNPLKPWDVITRIGDADIDDEGMIKVNANLRVHFGYQVQKVARNGMVPLTIVRDGKAQQVQMPVPVRRPMLIDSLEDEYPSYFVYGPLVFSRATLESFSLMRRPEQAAGNPMLARLGDPPSAERSELVVVCSPLFPSPLSKGYSNPTGSVIRSINGTPIRSFEHLVAVLRDLKDEYVVIDFDNRVSEGLVFPRAQLVAATEEILSDNGVRAQGSPDALKVWQGRP